MVRTRIIFGTLMTLAAFGVLVLDAYLSGDWDAVQSADLWQRLLHRGGPATLLVFLLALRATTEFNRLLSLRGTGPFPTWTRLLVGLLVLLPCLAAALAPTPSVANAIDMAWTMRLLVIALTGIAIGLIIRRHADNGMTDFAGAVLCLIYLGLFLGFAVRLRVSLPGPAGAWVILTWVIVVKFTDVGAYFTGLMFGRTPLIPAISPKKTMEGAFGGMVVGVASGLGAWWLLPEIRPVFGNAVMPGIVYFFFFSLVMSVLGQVGDLVESLLKRSASTKDSGAVIPTFGGILDVIDSLLLTGPVAWLMLAPGRLGC